MKSDLDKNEFDNQSYVPIIQDLLRNAFTRDMNQLAKLSIDVESFKFEEAVLKIMHDKAREYLKTKTAPEW